MSKQHSQHETNQDRRLVMKAIGAGAVVGAIAGINTPMNAKPKKKGDDEPTEAELEKLYAETESKISEGSTAKRPGLAAWQQRQGANLNWPAKYYLPWPAGIAHQVYQSWNGNKIGPPRATHMKAQNYYAWDFHIVRGQYICAARDGEVTNVHDSEPAGNENGNKIYVMHADGEQSVYAHIGSNTALVEVGDKVLAGEKLCQGSNEALHLHFVIWKGMIDYPCRFLDFERDNGVPQYGSSPASGNTGPDKNSVEGIKKNYHRGEAAFKAKDYLAALKFFKAATEVEVRIDEYEKSLERIEECRTIIDEKVQEAITQAKGGDFAGAEKRFKEIRKQYGDYAGERIDAALDELKDDKDFKAWVDKQRSGRLWVEARTHEKFQRWTKAEDSYKKLKKMYSKGDPEYKQIKKHLGQIKMAQILEE
ncbi:peptidoglycan DD-metalloendopeptidase family protein [Planctomycetota bacterium]|nr:peptidoglycan DD-metalloendopeptidase family protein [Planctomycetota bacterium]